MSLNRIAKLFAAQNANQVVVILQQLLLAPAFLHVLGSSLYGQWIALSAAIQYLGTFNYGLQTYTVMQMTIHYNRDEKVEAERVQSAGLRILLGAFLAASVLLSAVFLIPLARWLHLTVSPVEAQLTLYLLGMQMMANMLFGFFSTSYMVFGEAHRGQHYGNVNQLLCMLASVGLVLARQPFPVIAAGPLIVTLGNTVLVAWDRQRRCPALTPSLSYWEPGSLRGILKPSSQYMLLASANVLAYQVPLLLMQRLLGPEIVTVFSLTRTVYSMSRRVLYLVTDSLSAEITLVVGQKDWPRLHRLYELSERIILMMTPPITFGTMLATPLLLQLWLHRSLSLFHPGVCLTLGVTVSVLSIKEHKYQFQFSSNQIAGISWQTLVIHALTALVSIPLMLRLGIQGYLCAWLLSETLQLLYLLRLNDALFAGHARLNHWPVYQLLGCLAACTALLYWPEHHIQQLSYLWQGMASTALFAVLTVGCYWLFGVDEVRDLVWKRLASRFQPARV